MRARPPGQGRRPLPPPPATRFVWSMRRSPSRTAPTRRRSPGWRRSSTPGPTAESPSSSSTPAPCVPSPTSSTASRTGEPTSGSSCLCSSLRSSPTPVWRRCSSSAGTPRLTARPSTRWPHLRSSSLPSGRPRGWHRCGSPRSGLPFSAPTSRWRTSSGWRTSRSAPPGTSLRPWTRSEPTRSRFPTPRCTRRSSGAPSTPSMPRRSTARHWTTVTSR